MPRGDQSGGREHPAISWLEKLTLIHLLILTIGSAWALGGNSDRIAMVLSAWESLGLALTLFAIRRARRNEWNTVTGRAKWLWPLLALNVLVVLSSFNPNFRAVSDGARTMFVEITPKFSLPSSAIPAISLHALWFFDATYLSCFNLLLINPLRKTIRLLLVVTLSNAALLAVFGTLQKLMGAKGLFFGLVKSPQVFFFSSFIYHNHWGAYAVLTITLALGLVFHFLRRADARDPWHSPALALVIVVVMLGATLPLSSSRSCTLMGAAVVSLAFLHWAALLFRQRSDRKGRTTISLIISAVGLIAALGFVYDLGRPVIQRRAAMTIAQVAQLKGTGTFGSRALLYRDTWNMAREKIWFGWGMGSFPVVFFQRNTQVQSHGDGLPMYFEDAHSDWLQSASEVGLVGVSLLGLCGMVPLYKRRRALTQSPLIGYLLGGCALILLYAWLEFPFGNRAVVILFWVCFFSAISYGRTETAREGTIT